MSSTLPLVEETKFLIPIVTILGISVLLTVIIQKLKLNFIPTFVIEIIVGIVLKQLFYDSSYKIEYNGVVEVMYSMGLIFIMFLSGYDNNLLIIKHDRLNQNNQIDIRKMTIVFLILIYIFSFISSLLLYKFYINKLIGILLLTIVFASTFAGIVVPMLKDNTLIKSQIKKFIIYFSTISELISIVALSFIMTVSEFKFINVFGMVMLLLLLIVVWLFNKFLTQSSKKLEEGYTYIYLRIIIIFLGLSVIFGEFIGGEYILGAFILGMFLKKINVYKKEVEKLESFSYGIFTPIFFVLVGTKLDVKMFEQNPKWLFVVLLLSILLIICKIPLIYFAKKYDKKTMSYIISLISCTLIVGVAVEHFGIENQIFSEEFGECIIFSSIITCIISSVVSEKITIKMLKRDKYENYIEEREFNSI